MSGTPPNCIFDAAETDQIRPSIKTFLDGDRTVSLREFARELGSLPPTIGDSLDDDMLDELNQIIEEYNTGEKDDKVFIGDL